MGTVIIKFSLNLLAVLFIIDYAHLASPLSSEVVLPSDYSESPSLRAERSKKGNGSSNKSVNHGDSHHAKKPSKKKEVKSGNKTADQGGETPGGKKKDDANIGGNATPTQDDSNLLSKFFSELCQENLEESVILKCPNALLESTATSAIDHPIQIQKWVAAVSTTQEEILNAHDEMQKYMKKQKSDDSTEDTPPAPDDKGTPESEKIDYFPFEEEWLVDGSITDKNLRDKILTLVGLNQCKFYATLLGMVRAHRNGKTWIEIFDIFQTFYPQSTKGLAIDTKLMEGRRQRLNVLDLFNKHGYDVILSVGLTITQYTLLLSLGVLYSRRKTIDSSKDSAPIYLGLWSPNARETLPRFCPMHARQSDPKRYSHKDFKYIQVAAASGREQMYCQMLWIAHRLWQHQKRKLSEITADDMNGFKLKDPSAKYLHRKLHSCQNSTTGTTSFRARMLPKLEEVLCTGNSSLSEIGILSEMVVLENATMEVFTSIVMAPVKAGDQYSDKNVTIALKGVLDIAERWYENLTTYLWVNVRNSSSKTTRGKKRPPITRTTSLTDLYETSCFSGYKSVFPNMTRDSKEFIERNKKDPFKTATADDDLGNTLIDAYFKNKDLKGVDISDRTLAFALLESMRATGKGLTFAEEVLRQAELNQENSKIHSIMDARPTLLEIVNDKSQNHTVTNVGLYGRGLTILFLSVLDDASLTLLDGWAQPVVRRSFLTNLAHDLRVHKPKFVAKMAKFAVKMSLRREASVQQNVKQLITHGLLFGFHDIFESTSFYGNPVINSKILDRPSTPWEGDKRMYSDESLYPDPGLGDDIISDSSKIWDAVIGAMNRDTRTYSSYGDYMARHNPKKIKKAKKLYKQIKKSSSPLRKKIAKFSKIKRKDSEEVKKDKRYFKDMGLSAKIIYSFYFYYNSDRKKMTINGWIPIVGELIKQAMGSEHARMEMLDQYNLCNELGKKKETWESHRNWDLNVMQTLDSPPKNIHKKFMFMMKFPMGMLPGDMTEPWKVTKVARRAGNVIARTNIINPKLLTWTMFTLQRKSFGKTIELIQRLFHQSSLTTRPELFFKELKKSFSSLLIHTCRLNHAKMREKGMDWTISGLPVMKGAEQMTDPSSSLHGMKMLSRIQNMYNFCEFGPRIWLMVFRMLQSMNNDPEGFRKQERNIANIKGRRSPVKTFEYNSMRSILTSSLPESTVDYFLSSADRSMMAALGASRLSVILSTVFLAGEILNALKYPHLGVLYKELALDWVAGISDTMSMERKARKQGIILTLHTLPLYFLTRYAMSRITSQLAQAEEALSELKKMEIGLREARALGAGASCVGMQFYGGKVTCGDSAISKMISSFGMPDVVDSLGSLPTSELMQMAQQTTRSQMFFLDILKGMLPPMLSLSLLSFLRETRLGRIEIKGRVMGDRYLRKAISVMKRPFKAPYKRFIGKFKKKSSENPEKSLKGDTPKPKGDKLPKRRREGDKEVNEEVNEEEIEDTSNKNDLNKPDNTSAVRKGAKDFKSNIVGPPEGEIIENDQNVYPDAGIDPPTSISLNSNE